MALDGETRLTVKQLSARIPGKPHVKSIRRWMIKGIYGGIKLERSHEGGRIYTSLEAYRRFQERIEEFKKCRNE